MQTLKSTALHQWRKMSHDKHLEHVLWQLVILSSPQLSTTTFRFLPAVWGQGDILMIPVPDGPCS